MSLSLPFSSAKPPTVLPDLILAPDPDPDTVPARDKCVALGIVDPLKNQRVNRSADSSSVE